MILRLRNGREFVFECESYTIERLKYDGSLSSFTYNGGVGSCPLWFDIEDIEAIIEEVEADHDADWATDFGVIAKK